MFNEKGQSLIEVIVATTVGILVVTALTFAVIFSLRNAHFAKNSAQATKLAQEGIERVRTGRDRNSLITDLVNVDSWNGAQPIWDYQISGNGRCEDTAISGSRCYFNVDSNGMLTQLLAGFASTTFPSSAESITYANQEFKRTVILTDDLNHDGTANDDYQNQKEVTVIVAWTDFAGVHESKLTTILRKL